MRPLAPIFSPAVSVQQGSYQVTVTGNVDCSAFNVGTMLHIGNYGPTTAASGTEPDENGISTITLARPWAGPDVTGEQLLASMGYQDLLAAIYKLQDLRAAVNPLKEQLEHPFSATSIAGQSAHKVASATSFTRELIENFKTPQDVLDAIDAADSIAQIVSNVDAALQGVSNGFEELAAENSERLVGGAPARRLSQTVIQVSHLKALPTVGLRHGQQYSVAGFYAGSNLGGGLFVYDANRPKADHNGGTVIAPEALAAWDGSPSSLSNLFDWSGTGLGCHVKQKNTINFYDFGALPLPNYSTNAIRQAVKVMSLEKTPISQKEGDFKVNGYVRANGWVDIDAIDARVNFEDGGFEFYNINHPKQPLTSYINTFLSFASRPDIEVAGVRGCKITMPNSDHGIVVYDVLKVLAEDSYPWINPNFSAKRGEFVNVLHISGNEIWVDRQIDAGYTSIIKVDRQNKCKVHLNITNNGEVTSESIRLCAIRSYVDIDVKIKCFESLYSALYVAGCFNGSVELVAANFRNFRPPAGTRFGYGVVDQNCEGISFKTMARGIRHAYTTTHGGSATEQHAYGQSRNSTITGLGYNCITPFDTHASGEGLVFQNAYSFYSYGSGFSDRAKDTTFINCHSVGNGDSAFFIFNNEPAGVNVGRGGITRLKNCTSKLHRRALRTGYTNNSSAKWGDGFRFNVEIIDCDFDCNIFSEAVLLQNTKLKISTLNITNSDPASSTLPAQASAGNPVNLRSLFNAINSEIDFTDLTANNTASDRLVTFAIEADRTLNALAETVIQGSGLALNDGGFSSYSELIYTRRLQGLTSNFNYTDGLLYCYVDIVDVKTKYRTVQNMMRDEVSSFFEIQSNSRSAGCILTAKQGIRRSPMLNGGGSFEGFSYSNPVGVNQNYTLNLKSFYLQYMPVRFIVAANTRVDVDSITNTAGRMASGMVIEFINDGSPGSGAILKVDLPNLNFPSTDLLPGQTFRIIFDGTNWRRLQQG